MNVPQRMAGVNKSAKMTLAPFTAHVMKAISSAIMKGPAVVSAGCLYWFS